MQERYLVLTPESEELSELISDSIVSGEEVQVSATRLGGFALSIEDGDEVGYKPISIPATEEVVDLLLLPLSEYIATQENDDGTRSVVLAVEGVVSNSDKLFMLSVCKHGLSNYADIPVELIITNNQDEILH